MSKRYRVGLIDYPGGLRHYGSALALLDAETVWGLDWHHPERYADLDLCITAGEYDTAHALAVRTAVRMNVPVLLVMDGVLEWRNTWKHYDDPSSALATPFLQPALSHKIACFGVRQVQLLESLGNVGKCECTGAARLDGWLTPTERPTRRAPGFRVLIASATTPAFNDSQRRVVEGAVSDLLRYFATASEGTIVSWRLSEGLAHRLKIPEQDRRPLPDVLADVDAVICTPSTLVLEAMLADIPVAAIDYSHAPSYLSPAWRITAAEQIADVVRQLAHPPPERLLHQRCEAALQLRSDGPATPRLVNLMQSMIELGRAQKAAGHPLSFPHQLVPQDVVTMPYMSLLERFPDRDELRISSDGELQAEIAHLRALCARQARQIAQAESRGRYGDGSLWERMLHCFPHPRRMYRSWMRWKSGY